MNRSASSRCSDSGWRCSSSSSLLTSACTSSFCDDTDTYSPVAIENAPAASPARPVSTRSWREPPPPPTPAISETLVTRPSIAPNTAGRSQPPATSRCWCPRSSPWDCAAAVMVSNLRAGPDGPGRGGASAQGLGGPDRQAGGAPGLEAAVQVGHLHQAEAAQRGDRQGRGIAL